MGSIITLGINKMEIDWGKNNVFSNHSSLFQKNDFEQKIPYYTVDDDNKVIIQYENGAKKKLKDIKERLDLLGYDLKGIEKKYNEIVNEYEYNTDYKMTISFEKFKTVGPLGNQINNINGKAVSIECFLDLTSVDGETIVRWKNYNERMQEYQGSLENKDRYTVKFKRANLLDGSYDCSKLKYLID